MAFRYNRIVSNRYFEILDFINMHYCLTRRTDSEFWRDVQKDEHITGRLRAKLDFWQRKMPTLADFSDQAFYGFQFDRDIPLDDPEFDTRPPVDCAGLWNHASYEAILFGMDFRGPEFRERLGNKRKPSVPLQYVVNAIKARAKSIAAAPCLAASTSWYAAMESWPAASGPGLKTLTRNRVFSEDPDWHNRQVVFVFRAVRWEYLCR